MITGRGSGSGKYSYHKRHNNSSGVMVAHMPEDNLSIRIVFSHMEENNIPTLKISSIHAEMLWSALSGMAKDLKWEEME